MTLDDLIAGAAALRDMHGGKTQIVVSVTNGGPDVQMMDSGIDLCAPPVTVTTAEGVRDVLILTAKRNED